MSVTANLTLAAYLVTTLALAALGLRAWTQARGRKIAWLATAFLLLLAKAVYLTVLFFSTSDWRHEGMIPALVLDVLAMGAFYQAVLRRSGT